MPRANIPSWVGRKNRAQLSWATPVFLVPLARLQTGALPESENWSWARTLPWSPATACDLKQNRQVLRWEGRDDPRPAHTAHYRQGVWYLARPSAEAPNRETKQKPPQGDGSASGTRGWGKGSLISWGRSWVSWEPEKNADYVWGEVGWEGKGHTGSQQTYSRNKTALSLLGTLSYLTILKAWLTEGC